MSTVVRALAVEQLCATDDPDTVAYWLDEYVSVATAALQDATVTATNRSEATIDAQLRKIAVLRLALAVARTRLEGLAVPG